LRGSEPLNRLEYSHIAQLVNTSFLVVLYHLSYTTENLADKVHFMVTGLLFSALHNKDCTHEGAITLRSRDPNDKKTTYVDAIVFNEIL
jgi:hypothetical protein